MSNSPHNVSLILPFPPTVNSYWLTPRGNNMKVLSKPARVFRQAVGVSIEEQVPGITFDSPIYVEVTLFPPDKRRRDLDNYMKGLLDALTHAGLILDDSLIDQLFIMRGEVITCGRTLVEFTQAGPIIPWESVSL